MSKAVVSSIHPKRLNEKRRHGLMSRLRRPRVDKLAFDSNALQLLLELHAEIRGVSRILAFLAQGRSVVIEQIDGWVAGTGVFDRGVFLDPWQNLFAMGEEFLETRVTRPRSFGSMNPNAPPPYRLFGVHSFISRGSSDVCAIYAEAHHGLGRFTSDRIAAGGICQIGVKRQPQDRAGAGRCPETAMRFLSMSHSSAFDRTNCNARAPSRIGHSRGGFTPTSCACHEKR